MWVDQQTDARLGFVLLNLALSGRDCLDCPANGILRNVSRPRHRLSVWIEHRLSPDMVDTRDDESGLGQIKHLRLPTPHVTGTCWDCNTQTRKNQPFQRGYDTQLKQLYRQCNPESPYPNRRRVGPLACKTWYRR